MSILDDYDKLADTTAEGMFETYIKELKESDAPAFYQAWYDILNENFLNVSDIDKIIYLNVLKDYYPWWNMWDFNDSIIEKCRTIEEIRHSIEKSNSIDYRDPILGISPVRFRMESEAYIQKVIDQYINVYSESWCWETDNSDILNALETIGKLSSTSNCTKPTDIREEYYNTTHIIDNTLLRFIGRPVGSPISTHLHKGAFRVEYKVFRNNFGNEYNVIQSKYQDIKYSLEQIISYRIKNKDT